MRDPFHFPKLRWPIDISVQESEGDSALVFMCPLGVAPQPLALIPGIAPIVQDFTGNNSTEDIVKKYAHYGVTPELLKDLVDLLNTNLYLDTPAFHKAQQEMKEGYFAQQTREPALAGLSYAAEESMLEKQLMDFIGKDDYTDTTGRALFGLVAPHIDYHRGGLCYGKAYGHLQHFEHDLYLLLGTSHQYSPHMFHLTAKSFETPLGTLPCDETFVHTLANHYGEDRSFADEFLHKKEHSLELQTPFLQMTHASKKIVPVLIGSFYQMLKEGKAPSEFEVYERFVEGLTKLVADEIEKGVRVLPIASVDMAHVGQFFGDKKKLTPEFMEVIESRDMQYLETIVSQDKEALFSHIAEDFDARRICGFPTMYLLLDLYDRLGISYQARTYDYQQAVNYDNDCAVTFAAMGLYEG